MEKLNVACFFCAVNYIFYISYSTSSQNDLQTLMACEGGLPRFIFFLSLLCSLQFLHAPTVSIHGCHCSCAIAELKPQNFALSVCPVRLVRAGEKSLTSGISLRNFTGLFG